MGGGAVSGIVCSDCGVPKPPICYEHYESRKGALKTVCIQCLRARRRGTRHAYYVEHSKEIKQKKFDSLGPDGMAESVATSWEKRGLV